MLDEDVKSENSSNKRKRSREEDETQLIPAPAPSRGFFSSLGSGIYSACSYAVYPVVLVGQTLSSVTIPGFGAISYTLPAACAMLEAGPSLRELGLADHIVDATANGTVTLATRVASVLESEGKKEDVMETSVLSGILETLWMMGARYMTDVPSRKELSQVEVSHALGLQKHCEAVWANEPALRVAGPEGPLHERPQDDALIEKGVEVGANLVMAGKQLSDHITRVRTMLKTLSKKKNAAELRLAGGIISLAGSAMSDHDSELIVDDFLDAAIRSACESVRVQQDQEGGWAVELVGGFLVMLQKTGLHKMRGNLVRCGLAKVVKGSHNRVNEEYIKNTLVRSLEVGGMRVVGHTLGSFVDALQNGSLVPTDLVSCTQMQKVVGFMESMMTNMEHFAKLVSYQAYAVSLVGEVMELAYSMRTLSREISRGVGDPNPSRRSLNHILLAPAHSDIDFSLNKLSVYTPGNKTLLRQILAVWELQLVLVKYMGTPLGSAVDGVMVNMQEFWNQPSGEFGERFNKAAAAALDSAKAGGHAVSHGDLGQAAGKLTGEVLHVKMKNKVLGSMVPMCLAGGQAYCGNVWGALWTTAGGLIAPVAASAVSAGAASQVSRVDWDQKLGTSLHVAIRMLGTFCESFYLGLSEQEKQQIELRLNGDPSVLGKPMSISLVVEEELPLGNVEPPPLADMHAVNGDAHVGNGDMHVANGDAHVGHGDMHVGNGDAHVGNEDVHMGNGVNGSAPPLPEIPPWTCQICTLDNGPGREKCGACDAPNPFPLPDGPPDGVNGDVSVSDGDVLIDVHPPMGDRLVDEGDEEAQRPEAEQGEPVEEQPANIPVKAAETPPPPSIPDLPKFEPFNRPDPPPPDTRSFVIQMPEDMHRDEDDHEEGGDRDGDKAHNSPLPPLVDDVTIHVRDLPQERPDRVMRANSYQNPPTPVATSATALISSSSPGATLPPLPNTQLNRSASGLSGIAWSCLPCRKKKVEQPAEASTVLLTNKPKKSSSWLCWWRRS